MEPYQLHYLTFDYLLKLQMQKFWFCLERDVFSRLLWTGFYTPHSHVAIKVMC